MRTSLKKCIVTGAIAASGIWGGGLSAESVAEKAQTKRIEMVQYMRILEPLVYNFPCEPFPACMDQLRAPGDSVRIAEGPRIKQYLDIKQIYQQGMVYFYEGNYINAYNRFLDTQVRVDHLLEELSQSYLERAEIMLRDAIEKKNPNDPDDRTVVDISVQFGPGSRRRQDFAIDRESPQTGRRYNARDYHWAMNKYRIEKNVEYGYRHLGMAKEARYRALRADANNTPEQRINPDQRRNRIELYIASIHLARMAKMNAAFLFALKYPFDNYALQNPFGQTEAGLVQEPYTPTLEDVRMTWSENPYVLPKALHPIFDLRTPAEYRRDEVDARNEIYQDMVDSLVRMQYVEEKPQSFQRQQGGGAQGGQGGAGNPGP
ncbi:MAG: hypothetical protein K1X75_14620 [Leptospirales bacterium]|nr:hypothetical protein [Leptospirales bacterium]